MASRSDNLDKNTSIKNSHVLLASPEHVPWYRGVLVPGPPQIPRSTESQVPYIKWCRAWHTVAPPHIQIPNHRLKIMLVGFMDAKPRDMEG